MAINRQRAAAAFAGLAAAISGLGQGPAQAQPARMQGARAAGEDPARIVAPSAAAVPNGVTLRPGGAEAVLRSVPVLRRMSAAQLRANPRLQLGRTRIDLTPVLTRRGALANVAQRLQESPNVGRVNVADVQVSEIAQGLVVRSFLNYQLKIGACTDARRRQVETLGLRCVSRLSDTERGAAFSTPGNVHYIADPRLRVAALAKARAAAAAQAADFAKDVATLRAQLKDPVQRKQIEAEIGAAEAQRLSLLPDEELAGELVNAAETKVEQVMFLPKLDLVEKMDWKALQLAVATKPPAKAAPKTVSTDTTLDPATYLTGFTLGRDYEWQQRVETTIKWCVLGCKKHYYAEVHAGFSYGFGLRFPIRVGGNFHYQQDASGEHGLYTANFHPIDGSPADYAAAGLSGDKIFAGKELVAQVQAHAGFSAHVPIVPDPPSLDFTVGKDFTELLPAPFANGQIAPPAPHSDTPKAQFIFDKFDLLGGRINFGFAGAQVFPAVEVGLHSDELTFDLRDDVSNAVTKLTANNQQVPLAVNGAHTSSFTISNPVYNVGFVITPGIVARLFIDIEVWSHTWDFPAWFPELTIALPPGGVNFACHEGTICGRTWQFTTLGGTTVQGPKGVALGALQSWGTAFDAKWLSQCVDDTCTLGVRLVRLGTVLYGQEQLGGDDQATDAKMKALNQLIDGAEKQADKLAALLVQQAQVRHTGKTTDAISALAEAVWDKKCKDKDCLLDVHGIAVKMGPRAKQVQTQNPDYSTFQVLGVIGKEFSAQFQDAIDRSQARANVQAVGQLAEAVWSKQCLDALCRTHVSLIAGQMIADARQLQKAQPDLSSLALSSKLGPPYGARFQKEIDASKARNRRVR